MKRKDIIILIIFVIFTVVVYIWSNNGSNEFLKNSKYTEGVVVSDFHFKNTFGGAGYDYVFYLNNLRYSRTASKGDFLKGKKYLVAYDSLNPSSCMLLDIYISDYKYEIPNSGWRLKDIPIKLDSSYIKKMRE